MFSIRESHLFGEIEHLIVISNSLYMEQVDHNFISNTFYMEQPQDKRWDMTAHGMFFVKNIKKYAWGTF